MNNPTQINKFSIHGLGIKEVSEIAPPGTIENGHSTYASIHSIVIALISICIFCSVGSSASSNLSSGLLGSVSTLT